VTARAIVLDANILVRAVLGTHVPELLAAHAAQATFLAPDIAFDEARLADAVLSPGLLTRADRI
jgi:hypothetical protein